MALRVLGRVLSCAAALAAGAALAHGVPGAGVRPAANAAPGLLSSTAAQPDPVALPADAPSPDGVASSGVAAELQGPSPAADETNSEQAGEVSNTEELSAAEWSTGGAYKDGMIITGSTPHRLILFTFDDGPDPSTTPLLLDRLDEAGIKAVFFLVGNRIAGTTLRERQQASIAREIARRGHLIGGHTLDHVQLPLLEDEAAKRQLAEPEAIFERVLGSRPWLLRPPFGAHSQRIDQLIAARHYTIVLWNLGSGDFQVRTAEDVYRTWLKVFERREREFGDRGGIILLHDTHSWSVDAFQMIVSHLLARNCELLEQGEELFDFVGDLAFFYVPRGDAPPEAEGPRIELPPEVLEARQQALRESTARRCKSLAAAY